MKNKFLLICAGLVLAMVGLSACETTTNSNMNANMRNVNSNTAVVVNTNANVSTNSGMSNSNRWNANITREEYERNKADYEKEKGSSTIGQGANDMWLWVKTKASLASEDDLRDSTINVDVVNDVVTLKGTVETAAQRAAAEKVAKEIDGVKSVKNELKVQAADSMTNQMTGNSGGKNTNSR